MAAATAIVVVAMTIIVVVMIIVMIAVITPVAVVIAGEARLAVRWLEPAHEALRDLESARSG